MVSWFIYCCILENRCQNYFSVTQWIIEKVWFIWYGYLIYFCYIDKKIPVCVSYDYATAKISYFHIYQVFVLFAISVMKVMICCIHLFYKCVNILNRWWNILSSVYLNDMKNFSNLSINHVHKFEIHSCVPAFSLVLRESPVSAIVFAQIHLFSFCTL